jgi:hypothetical protein
MSQEDPRILELRAMREKVRQGGGKARVDAQHAKGKLTARERIDLLIDKGTFHELEPYVTHQGDELGIAKDHIPGDGVVTGYGKIDGRPVYVYSQDFTVYGGTMSDMVSRKICRSDGPGAAQRRTAGRPDRFGRRAHPGGREVPGRLRRDLPSQRPLFGLHPPDFRHARALRRRCGLQPGHHRRDHHGEGTTPTCS